VATSSAATSAASIVVDDGIIVFGGEIFTPTPRVFANLWRDSVTKDKWTSLPDIPTPRHGLVGGRIGKKIYLVGGATDLNQVFTLR
jgi:hypothetical protein